MPVTRDMLLGELKELQRLTAFEQAVATVRRAQAASGSVAEELAANAAKSRERLALLGQAVQTVGGTPDLVRPALGKLGALVQAQVNQVQTLQGALLGDLALEHQLRERARYARTLATSLGETSVVPVLDRLDAAHSETIAWLERRLAEVARTGTSALRPTPVQAVVGSVRRVAGAPFVLAAEGVNRVGGLVGRLTGRAASALPQAVEQVGDAVTSVAGAAETAAETAASTAVSALERTGAVAEQAAGAAGQLARSAADTAGDAVETSAGLGMRAAGATVDAASTVVRSSADVASSAAGTASDAVNSAAGTATDAASSAVSTAADAASSAAATAADAGSSAAGTAAEAAGFAARTAADAVTTVADAAGSAADVVPGAADSAADTAADTAVAAASALGDDTASTTGPTSGASPEEITHQVLEATGGDDVREDKPPFAGYERLTGDRVIRHVNDTEDIDELRRLLAFEQAHKARKGVLTAVQERLTRLSVDA